MLTGQQTETISFQSSMVAIQEFDASQLTEGPSSKMEEEHLLASDREPRHQIGGVDLRGSIARNAARAIANCLCLPRQAQTDVFPCFVSACHREGSWKCRHVSVVLLFSSSIKQNSMPVEQIISYS